MIWGLLLGFGHSETHSVGGMDRIECFVLQSFLRGPVQQLGAGLCNPICTIMLHQPTAPDPEVVIGAMIAEPVPDWMN